MSEFGLRVGKTDRGTYVAHLPHRCDEWEIARAGNKQEVIDALDRFILEASEARSLLAGDDEGLERLW